MAHQVFISYSHRDKKVADAACARLEQAGHRCWIAPRDIAGGEWGKAIVDGIRGARIFVLIFSGHANRSPQVNREVERAVSNGLPIIPLRIENIDPSDSLEYFISNQHWLDAMTPPLARHLDHLTEMVGRLLGEPSAQPGAAAPTERSRRTGWLGGIGLLAAAAAATAAWIYLGFERMDDPVAANGTVPTAVNALEGPEAKSTPRQVSAPAVPVPDPSGTAAATLLDFASIRTDRAPGGRVAAPPYLHEAAVRVRAVEVAPEGSRLLFIANSEWYGGNAARPTVSENFLTLDVPAVVPSSFTLEFGSPLAELGFTVPALFPATSSGIIFPAFSATAYGVSGRQIDQAARELIRSFEDVPAQTFSLRASGGEGIVKVVFNSDPEGVAAFRAVLIEQMTFVRMGG